VALSLYHATPCCHIRTTCTVGGLSPEAVRRNLVWKSEYKAVKLASSRQRSIELQLILEQLCPSDSQLSVTDKQLNLLQGLT